ncbi:hypothetical protein SD71_07110 [Cohnella kolymensis]|uniref:Thioesterase domain-containing protein n=1 Tax=Cohnella kolymensis TaxID=1590652 RepID=A0ABR5A222_9BACL|nr:PaaI family thioesterase [Cohnella kolymensis]KIL35117.1 hypothetical protein SD71_15855 [Cohnella kolymensis]KIL36526.1 hypothetical protein SD71_07110 [Cohnella kolymensis]
MDTQELQQGFEDLIERAKRTFWGYLGCELVEIERNKVTVALDVKEHHLNPLGILHGGVHCGVLDSAMGIAAMVARPNENLVTSNLNIHFTSPVGVGRVSAVAEIVHVSGKMVTAQGTLTDENNNICAMATASFRVIDKKK